MKEQLKISVRFFDDREIRAVWDDDCSKWWFSVLDIVGALNEEPDYTKVRNYWKYLNPHCASTRGNACIHKAIGLSEFLFVYYRFYFGEGSLLDAKGVKQLL